MGRKWSSIVGSVYPPSVSGDFLQKVLKLLGQSSCVGGPHRLLGYDTSNHHSIGWENDSALEAHRVEIARIEILNVELIKLIHRASFDEANAIYIFCRCGLINELLT